MGRRNIIIVLAVLLALAIAQEIDNQQSDNEEQMKDGNEEEGIEEEGNEEAGKQEEGEEEEGKEEEGKEEEGKEEEGKEEEGKEEKVEEMEEEVEDNEEASGEAPSKRGIKSIPNIEYLFKGYNIIKGNPMDSSGIDPGFADQIFKIEYNDKKRTKDESFNIADNVDFTSMQNCGDMATLEKLMTVSDYQRSLFDKARVKPSFISGVAETSFTASTEYSKISKKLKSNSVTIFKSEVTCVVYEARLQTGTSPKITKRFRSFVKKMAVKKNYMEFLEKFGTHFVTMMNMGARFTKLDEMKKETEENLQLDSFIVHEAPEVILVGPEYIPSGIVSEETKQDARKYRKAVQSSNVISVGSKLPKDGDREKWRKSTISNPIPVFYHLQSIVSLFDGKIFKIKSVNLKEIKEGLSKALQEYCKELKKKDFPDVECKGPPKGCEGGSYCSINAKCTNNPKTGDPEQLYDCTCKKGYKGNGMICKMES